MGIARVSRVTTEQEHFEVVSGSTGDEIAVFFTGKAYSFVPFLSRITKASARFCVTCRKTYRQRKMSRLPGWSTSFCAPEFKIFSKRSCFRVRSAKPPWVFLDYRALSQQTARNKDRSPDVSSYLDDQAAPRNFAV
jgi:hypothetical protein